MNHFDFLHALLFLLPAVGLGCIGWLCVARHQEARPMNAPEAAEPSIDGDLLGGVSVASRAAVADGAVEDGLQTR
jgi:hypothetical protein